MELISPFSIGLLAILFASLAHALTKFQVAALQRRVFELEMHLLATNDAIIKANAALIETNDAVLTLQKAVAQLGPYR